MEPYTVHGLAKQGDYSERPDNNLSLLCTKAFVVQVNRLLKKIRMRPPTKVAFMLSRV